MNASLNEKDYFIDVVAEKLARSAMAKVKDAIKELHVQRGDSVRVTIDMKVEDLKYLLYDGWAGEQHE